jgi:isopenicillin N synthase-like dioxygenase
MNKLPIVDLGSLGEGDGASLTRIATEVGAARRDLGFFYVVNHGVDRALAAKTFAHSHDFLALPVADKRKLAIETIGCNRGYSGLLHEALDPARGPDMKEAFNVGLELAADDPDLVAGKPFRSLNAWPVAPGFRETLLSYYDACVGLGARLHRAFASNLASAAISSTTNSIARWRRCGSCTIRRRPAAPTRGRARGRTRITAI